MIILRKWLRRIIKIVVWLFCFFICFFFTMRVIDKGFLIFGLIGSLLFPSVVVAMISAKMEAPMNQKLKEVEKEFNLKYQPGMTLKKLDELASQAVSEEEHKKIEAMRFEVLYEDHRYEECLEMAQSWEVTSYNYLSIAEVIADLYLKLDRQNKQMEKTRSYEIINTKREKPRVNIIGLLFFLLIFSSPLILMAQDLAKGNMEALENFFFYCFLVVIMVFLLISSFIKTRNDKTYLAEKLIVVDQDGIDVWYIHRMIHISWNQFKRTEEVKGKSSRRGRVHLITVKNETSLMNRMDKEELSEYEKSLRRYGVSGIVAPILTRADVLMNIHAIRLYAAGKERNKYEEFGDLLREL